MDESLMHEGIDDRIAACARNGSCAGLVLKPMTLGGVARSMDLARKASERGWPVYFTHSFDSPIAAAATAEVALSSTGAVGPCGLDSFGRDDDWPSARVAQIERAAITPHDGAGLEVGAVVRAIRAATETS
jgi:L-alanine-DL-glutamate epimerase-like enolase superfamily enzyme